MHGEEQNVSCEHRLVDTQRTVAGSQRVWRSILKAEPGAGEQRDPLHILLCIATRFRCDVATRPSTAMISMFDGNPRSFHRSIGFTQCTEKSQTTEAVSGGGIPLVKQELKTTNTPSIAPHGFQARKQCISSTAIRSRLRAMLPCHQEMLKAGTGIPLASQDVQGHQ